MFVQVRAFTDAEFAYRTNLKTALLATVKDEKEKLFFFIKKKKQICKKMNFVFFPTIYLDILIKKRIFIGIQILCCSFLLSRKFKPLPSGNKL
jgi:hypothetical protein